MGRPLMKKYKKPKTRIAPIGYGGMIILILLTSHLTVAASVPVTRGLVMHLDASSITGAADGDVISVWPDISGRANNALSGSGAVDLPVYRTAMLNNRPAVHFGPGNCYMSFNELSAIRTVFWICKEDPAATGNRFLLGHSNYWDFHRGWRKIWDGTWASPYVLNGKTRLNGTLVNGSQTAVPMERFSLISLVTTGSVRANQLTRDRDNTAAGWHGDIAELLVYTSALTATEIASVESYLNQKYFPVSAPSSCVIFSPDGRLSASVIIDQNGHLACSLAKAGVPVLQESRIGIRVNGIDLAQGVTADWNQAPQQINQTYPWRGLKSQVVNLYNTVSFPITHLQSGMSWTFECRLYNDGLTYRYIVPGSGTRIVNGEATEWRLPPSASIWYQTQTVHYEGYYSRQAPSAIEPGTPIGFPVVAELPAGTGYAFLTEAALDNYSGMTLRTTASSTLLSTFENRTFYDGTQTAVDFTCSGAITTPWRITAAVDNLNDLVNCDIVHNVCPSPDPARYPDGLLTDWIKPGKATWNWWHEGDVTNFELQKEYVDEAAELNCQYYVADGGWWGMGEDDPYHDEYDYLKWLCDYAAQKNIRIHVWAWLGSYMTTAQRASFYGKLKTAGAAGVKFDFNNSESPDSIRLYKNALLEAADYQLMINFHGMVKPAGESRTWPNELTREGVIGLEWDMWDDIPPSHFATIPFTRLVAGHGDTTPCTLDPAFLRGTTYAFQIASAVVHHSPLLHWAEQPDLYLSSKAVDIIRKIEPCWDQTLVLDGSQIGSLAAFAKRKDHEWFVGILNAAASPAAYTLDLSFLDPGSYYAQIVRDDTQNRPEMSVENSLVTGGKSLSINMSPAAAMSPISPSWPYRHWAAGLSIRRPLQSTAFTRIPKSIIRLTAANRTSTRRCMTHRLQLKPPACCVPKSPPAMAPGTRPKAGLRRFPPPRYSPPCICPS
jgi:alpha-glucosidase